MRLHSGFLEAPIRIELMNKSFADFCLTAWLWRHTTLYDNYKVLTEKASSVEDASLGADYGARTRHLNLGKVALYQMS